MNSTLKNSYFNQGIFNKILNKIFGYNTMITLILSFFYCLTFLYLPVIFLNQFDSKFYGFERVDFTNYANDYSAVIQILVVLPLFIVARNILAKGWDKIDQNINATNFDNIELNNLNMKLKKIKEIFFIV